MKSLKLMVALLLTISLAACSLSLKDGDRWLEGKREPSTLNMTGTWDSSGSLSGGWGIGRFIQEGRNFSGVLGNYTVEGVVSGDAAYMVLSARGALYYTAILRKTEGGELTGKAVYVELADSKDARHATTYLITMKQVGGTSKKTDIKGAPDASGLSF